MYLLEASAQGCGDLCALGKGYPGQRLFFVLISDAVYIVPYAIRAFVFWLITIMPSRRAECRKEPLKVNKEEKEIEAVVGMLSFLETIESVQPTQIPGGFVV